MTGRASSRQLVFERSADHLSLRRLECQLRLPRVEHHVDLARQIPLERESGVDDLRDQPSRREDGRVRAIGSALEFVVAIRD